MSETDSIEVHVTPDDHDRAVLDATRALVVQNARFGKRYDLVAKWRSPRFQKVLSNVGAVVCGLGVVLAGLSVGIEWTDTGDIAWLRVGLLLFFFVLFLVFQNTERLQTAGLRRINDALAVRAATMLAATGERLPATVNYGVANGEVTGTWTDEDGEELAQWSHTITDSTYLLVGEAVVAGFDEPENLSPAFYCFLPGSGLDDLIDELEAAGATGDDIDASLLPEHVVERPWPNAG